MCACTCLLENLTERVRVGACMSERECVRGFCLAAFISFAQMKLEEICEPDSHHFKSLARSTFDLGQDGSSGNYSFKGHGFESHRKMDFCLRFISSKNSS